MKFCWVTLQVKNMEESIEFYKGLVGLEINRRFKAGEKMEIAFLGDGETKVELIYNEDQKDVNIGMDISLGFQVDSLEDTMDLIKKQGIDIHSGPFQPDPKTKFFYVLDPNKVKVQFVEMKNS